MARHNHNPNVRKRRKWQKNVGDPNDKGAKGAKK